MKENLCKALLILTLFSCTPVRQERESIMFLHYFTGNMSQGIIELTEEVNKKQKAINLVSTPLDHEKYKVSIRIQLETANPPDLFSYWAGARTEYLVNKGVISPIGKLFEDKIDPTLFDQPVLEACSYNGELYMLPLTRHYIGFFYNRKIFDMLNLEIPETWEELLKISELIKEKGKIPFSLGSKNRWPAQFWFDYLLLRTAGFDYRQDLMNKSAKYTDLEVLKTMDFWKYLIENNYFNRDHIEKSWDEAADELINGDSAMTLMGTWIIPYLEQEGFSSVSDYGFFPFPIVDEQIENTALGPVDGVLMSVGSKNKDYSEEILYYFAQPEIQESFNIISGAIAPHKNVKNSAYSAIQLQIKKLIGESAYWAFNYDLATEPATSEAGLDFFADFLETPENYENLLKELQITVSSESK